MTGKPAGPGNSPGSGLVRPGERVDDLQRRGFRLIQDPQGYRFGLDAVLLAHFAAAQPGERVLDLCCGNGAVAILLAARTPGLLLRGVELRPEEADRARRNALLNGLDAQFWTGDVRTPQGLLPEGAFDLAVANPPYIPVGAGRVNPNPALALSRHELTCTLADVCRSAAFVLRPDGRFCLIHRAERLGEALEECRRSGLAPVQTRLVCHQADKPPVLALLESVRGERASLVCEALPTLVIYRAEGGLTPEAEAIYWE